jgi:ubiquitin-protein ligase
VHGSTVALQKPAQDSIGLFNQSCAKMDMVHTISNASEASSSDHHENKKKRGTHGRPVPTRTISRIGSDDLGMVYEAGPHATEQVVGTDGPAEILPYVEPEGRPVEEIDDDDDDDPIEDDDEDINSGGDVVDEEEESDYEYDDDEYAGFLGSANTFGALPSGDTFDGRSSPARIRDEDEQQTSDLPYMVVEQPTVSAAPVPTATSDGIAKWRQPSKAAVNMSLRAENEKSGGKRRLAQDLYRIMNQDTLEAGFSLHPAQEDCMDKWTINLFKFDEDSNLAKDMLVLGVDNIELSMSFPEQYPFEPPFVRVVKPRFKRQTGFVMNGALCMELLTKVRNTCSDLKV